MLLDEIKWEGISLYPSRTLVCASDLCMGMQNKLQWSQSNTLMPCFQVPLGVPCSMMLCQQEKKNPQAFEWICSPLNQAPSWSYLRVFSTNGYQCKLAQTSLPFGILKYFLPPEVSFFVVYSVFLRAHIYFSGKRNMVELCGLPKLFVPFPAQAFITINVK
jgi:hypothetical protein